MEVVVRNINLGLLIKGLLIKASIFPAIAGSTGTTGDMVLFTLLLYGGQQKLVAALMTFQRRCVSPR
jgi:BASS family bile acid:Na+ symporter